MIKQPPAPESHSVLSVRADLLFTNRMNTIGTKSIFAFFDGLDASVVAFLILNLFLVTV